MNFLIIHIIFAISFFFSLNAKVPTSETRQCNCNAQNVCSFKTETQEAVALNFINSINDKDNKTERCCEPETPRGTIPAPVSQNNNQHQPNYCQLLNKTVSHIQSFLNKAHYSTYQQVVILSSIFDNTNWLCVFLL